MPNGCSQGLKPKLFKQIALLMSICYLLGPLQTLLTELLHELSHGLEMPTSVLSHETTAYDYMEVHHSHAHDNPKADHDHKFIDLVVSIFEASNKNHESDKNSTIETKLKKHITAEVMVVLIQFLEKAPKKFGTFKVPLHLGHSKVPDIPPQLLFG